MDRTQKNNNVPKLRFPGFTGEWEEKVFSDVCITVTPPLKLQSRDYLKGGKYPIVDQSQDLICGWTNDESGVISDNPVIIFGDHTCVLKYIAFPFVQGADGVKIIKTVEGYWPLFVYQSFLANPINPNGYKRHFSDLKEKRFLFPKTLSEQKKIADCLATLDSIITTELLKRDELRAYKKGLMQQLFPQSGETTPRLRFPGFKGEWKEFFLGDSFDERTEKNRGDLPLLSLGDEGLVMQSDTKRKDNSNADKSKYLRVSVDDIAYNTMRMWQGRCVYANIEGIVSPAYTVCKPKEGIDSLFHYYLFKTKKMINLFHQNSQGLVSDTLNLKYEAFSKIKYYLPPSLEEQKKIASCLSEMDEIITAQGKLVEVLKSHKKGLMQQLFPQLDK